MRQMSIPVMPRNLDKNDELEIIEKLNGGKDKDAEETSKEDI